MSEKHHQNQMHFITALKIELSIVSLKMFHGQSAGPPVWPRMKYFCFYMMDWYKSLYRPALFRDDEMASPPEPPQGRHFFLFFSKKKKKISRQHLDGLPRNGAQRMNPNHFP